MHSFLINETGKDFILLRRRKINQFKFILPILVLLSIIAGLIKLGVSAYSIPIILLTFPVLGIALYKGVLEPQKIISKLIIRIEIVNSETLFFVDGKSFKSNIIKKKYGLNVFESSFKEYYTIMSNSTEYYLIPDFFDNIKEVEKNLI